MLTTWVWQVLDASARESIPSIVRWFQTVLHQPNFASVLGPVTLASVPLEAPKAGKKKGSEAGAKPKDNKKAAKENKPKQAPKAAAPGPATGVSRITIFPNWRTKQSALRRIMW